MCDTTPIPGQGTTYSYGRDDYGEYGSALEAETEFHVPEPLEFTPNIDLGQSPPARERTSKPKRGPNSGNQIRITGVVTRSRNPPKQ